MNTNTTRRYVWLVWAAAVLTYAAATAETAEGPRRLDLEALRKEPSAEKREHMLRDFRLSYLDAERRSAAEEIRSQPPGDRELAEKAAGILFDYDHAPPSRRDNIERICRAMAATNHRFAEAYSLYRRKNYRTAASRLAELRNPEEDSWFSAAVHGLLADCLIRDHQDRSAVDVYTDLLANLPERISFAAEAALRAAELYERLGRNFYAAQMYDYCFRQYASALGREELTRVLERRETLEALCRDPILALTGMLAHIRERLASKDIGAGTQRQQHEAVAFLEDLIQTLEEQQRSSGRPSSQPDSRRGRQAGERRNLPSASGRPGRPVGSLRDPAAGATESVLVPGPVSRPRRLSDLPGGTETDAWAELPPREKEAVRNLLRQRMAERRGQMVRDYHRRLAEEE